VPGGAAPSGSGPIWSWCTCPRAQLRGRPAPAPLPGQPRGPDTPDVLCHGCRRNLTISAGTFVHYAGEHYHVECLLDKLTGPAKVDMRDLFPYGFPH
jgi:hypothetical protein